MEKRKKHTTEKIILQVHFLFTASNLQNKPSWRFSPKSGSRRKVVALMRALPSLPFPPREPPAGNSALGARRGLGRGSAGRGLRSGAGGLRGAPGARGCLCGAVRGAGARAARGSGAYLCAALRRVLHDGLAEAVIHVGRHRAPPPPPPPGRR